MHEVWFIRGVHATTAIEGNTLSEEEVSQIAGGSLRLEPSRSYQGQEVENMLKSFSLAANAAIKEDSCITIDLIKEFNRLSLAGLETEKHVEPGHIRECAVTVGRYLCAPAEDCEYLLGELCKWLNETWCPDDWETHRASIAALKAIMAHLYLAWIHPFGDGNGRTARLLELYILLQAGYPTSAAHLLSNHYNQTRDRYYSRLQQASEAHEYGFSRSVLPFIDYALQGLVDGLGGQINEIFHEQTRVAWKDYVYDFFAQENASDTNKRRRTVAIEVGLRVLNQTQTNPDEDSVHKDDVPILSREIADLYKPMHGRALTRDLNALHKQDILIFENNKVRPNIDILAQMFTFRRHNPPRP